MTTEVFRRAVAASGLRKNNQKWLPVWVEKYARYHRVEEDQQLEVNADLVIAFLKDMKSRGTPAWQRLQAVRAIQSSCRWRDDAAFSGQQSAAVST